LYRIVFDLDSTSPIYPFANAARSVGRHLFVVRSRRWIARTGWILAVCLFALVWLLRRQAGWSSGEWVPLLGLAAMWALIGAALIWWRRPDTRTSLLTLDRVGGWRDRFCSAWDFQMQEPMTQGQSWHIQSAIEALPASVAAFPAALPRRSVRWSVLAMAMALLFSVLPWGRLPPAPGAGQLTEAMKNRAGEVEAALAQRLASLPPSSGLQPEEAAALEALRGDLTSALEALQNPESLTVGELLTALDSAARSAEAMAAMVGLPPEGWASPELIAAMERQPDAANLAEHIREKAPAFAAEEAEVLAALLDDDAIRPDTEERLRLELERIAAARTEIDLTRPVGERLGNAGAKLSRGEPKTSARELAELARYFRSLVAKEESREGLEDLAAALREAGESVASAESSEEAAPRQKAVTTEAGQSEGLQALDVGAMPADLARMLSPQMSSSGADPVGKNPLTLAQGEAPAPGQGIGDEPPVPGSQPAPESDDAAPPVPGSSGLQAPVPGSDNPSSDGGHGLAQSDEAKPGDGPAGSLMAPVPGGEPSEDGSLAGGASSGQPGGPAGRGGTEAGSGTAPLGEEVGEISAAQLDAEVLAQRGSEGESQLRSIEGTARAEGVQRSRQDVVKDFLAVEEQALDDASLPLTRRQHVIRYFSEIRRQFETSAENP
jgi:hypothetical protein